jgi:hypothetical protein
MKVTIEIDNLSSSLFTFEQLRFANEMSHEEFVEMLRYYAEVFANITTTTKE